MKLGPHIDRIYSDKKNATFKDHIEAAQKYIKHVANVEFNTISMFVAGPKTYNILLSDKDIEDIKKLNLNIYVHNTYISHPWPSNKLSDKTKAYHSIIKQLEICDKINAKGFIIHLPKNTIDVIIDTLITLFNPDITTKIYLEIPALKSNNSIFHIPKYLNELFDRIKTELDPNLIYFGLCIDTAHLWSCGVDISDYKSADLWLNELNIDPKSILIHFNDNDKELGHAPDIHNSLTDGKIWNKYKDDLQNSGLMAFFTYAKNNDIPIILERHTMTLLINDYIIIQQLI